MMNEDVTAEESRRAMDIIIRRTRDFEERGLKKKFSLLIIIAMVFICT